MIFSRRGRPATGAWWVPLVLVAWALSGAPSVSLADTPTEVKVESVKPKKTRPQTLRFLKENKDFVRARLDLLRANSIEKGERAGEFDPRFLAYRRILDEALAADSALAALEGQDPALLEGLAALGAIEGRLDRMDSLLAAQRERLYVLQTDFSGQQRTALLVLLAGYPRSSGLSELAVKLEDGTTHRVTIAPEQRESLRDGGIAQVFYGLVDPREQIIEVSVTGEAWPAGHVGYIRLDPKIDRLTLLKLDASSLEAARGAPSLRATTWLHADRAPFANAESPAP